MHAPIPIRRLRIIFQAILPLAAVFAALTLLQAQNSEEENLVPNGDMEWEGQWAPANVGGPTKPELVEITSEEKYGGANSLHVILQQKEPAENPSATSATFPTEEGRFYKVSFWYKILRGAFAAYMRKGANNGYVKLTKSPLTETGGWEFFECEYEEKEGGSGARFSITCQTDEVCEIYLDDVKIQPF